MGRIAAAVILTMLLAACGKSGNVSLVLEDDVWMACPPADTVSPATAACEVRTLEFRSNGQWSGKSCCGRVAGYYTIYEAEEQKRISLSVEILSREECVAEQEDPFYFERLTLAESYELEAGKLVLLDEEGEPVLMFRPVSTIQK